MKKLFLPFLAVAAIAMTSCSSKNAEATDETVDTGADLKAKIENCTDPDSLQLYVQQASEYAATLDSEAANEYVNEVVTIVSTTNPSSVSLLEVLKAYADSTTCAAIDNANGVKDAAVDAATGAVEAGKDAAESAVNNAKDQALNAANDAKAKADAAAKAAKEKAEADAKAAADAAKNKAANAIQSAADKAKNALGK